MSPIKNMLFALSLVVSAAAVVAPAASAQGTTIVMIDEGRILSDSKAGKDIQTKLKNLERQTARHFRPRSKARPAKRLLPIRRLSRSSRPIRHAPTPLRRNARLLARNSS